MVPGKPHVLFVKFDTPEAASEIIFQLTDFVFDEDLNAAQKLKAELAKNELHQHRSTKTAPREGQPTVWAPQKLPLALDAHPLQPAAFKRPRRVPPPALPTPPSVPASRAHPAAARHGSIAPSGQDIDTLACKVAGASTSDLVAYFEQLPGYVAMRDIGKVCFFKFDDPGAASNALGAAQSDGLAVEMARQNMSVEQRGAAEGAWEADHEDGARAGHRGDSQWQGWGRAQGDHREGGGDGETQWQSRRTEPESLIDTLACRAVGYTQEELTDFFASIEGFSSLKHCVKNCFVQFQTPELATQALEVVKEAGFLAEHARSNLR